MDFKMTIDSDGVGKNETFANSDNVQLASDRVHDHLSDYLRKREEIDLTGPITTSGIHPSLINPNPILENYGGRENCLPGNTLDFEDKSTDTSYEMSPARRGFHYLFEDITALNAMYNADNGVVPADDIRVIGDIIPGDDLSQALDLKIRYDIALRAGLVQRQFDEGIPLEEIIKDLHEKYPFINTLIDVVDQKGTFYQDNQDLAARVVAYDMFIDALNENNSLQEDYYDEEINKDTSWIDKLPENLRTNGRKIEAMSVASEILDGMMLEDRDPNDITDEDIRRYIGEHTYTAFGGLHNLSEADVNLIKRAAHHYNSEGSRFGIVKRDKTEGGGFYTTDDTIVNGIVLDNILRPSIIARAAKQRGNNFPVLKFLNKLRDDTRGGHLPDIHLDSLEEALLDDEPGMGLINALSKQDSSSQEFSDAVLRAGRVYKRLMSDKDVS